MPDRIGRDSRLQTGQTMGFETMRIIALEEHFIMPREEQNLPPGAHRGNDREKLLGFDVVAALLDLGDSRLAAMDAAGIDVHVANAE